MGYLTNVSISNDFWHEIAKDPEKFVETISVMMNYGQNSPLADMIDIRSGRNPDERRYRMYGNPCMQGVTVHHARHYDETQIIVNPYGHEAVNAQEIPSAIEFGWLDLSEYNEKTAEAVARELEDAAERIRRKLAEARKRREKDPDGISRDKRLDRPGDRGV